MDFKLDIVVSVSVKPVNPKVGTTQRGPWERNLYVVKETKSVLLHNAAAADVAALIPNAVAAIAEQQAMGVKPPKIVGIVTEGIPTATACDLVVTGNNQGVSTAPTCEYGVTTALGSSQASTVTPDASVIGTLTDYAFALTGLTASTKYYWRAKVVSASGTSYGPLRSFTTPAT